MIDTHCHLDLYKDPHSIAIEAEKKRITTIAVTNLPSHFNIALEHVARYKNIRAAIGLHPLLVEQHEAELPLFRKLIDKTSYLGEIGLDFSKEGLHTKEIQLASFRFVLDCAKGRPRFISLHTRGAENAALDILKEYNINSAVFHWYSGSLNTLERIIAMGHYISVNTSMVNSPKGRAIIKNVPINRVLTESDGHYIQLNGMPVIPENISLILDRLSDIWGFTFEKAERQVYSNFMNIIPMLKNV